MKQRLSKKLTGLFSLLLVICLANQSQAQDEEAAGVADDSTVTYPAAYFAEYSPVSVNDMINVIPGVNLSGGGRGGNRRGLGSGKTKYLSMASGSQERVILAAINSAVSLQIR